MNTKIIKILNKGIKAVKHPQLASEKLIYMSRRAVSDMLYPFGYNNYPHRVIFLAGMASSAMACAKNMLERIPGIYTRPLKMPQDVWLNQDICDSAFTQARKWGNILIKTHLNPTDENRQCLLRHGVQKIIVFHKDLRDVAVLRYHRMLDFPKSKDDPNYMDYERVGKEDALNHSIDMVNDHHKTWILDWVRMGKHDPHNILFVKYEDLKQKPVEEFNKMLAFYEIHLSSSRVEEIAHWVSQRMNSTRDYPKQDALSWGFASNPTSIEIGCWRKQMTQSQIDRCKNLFGSALIELGYERDLEWANSRKEVIG